MKKLIYLTLTLLGASVVCSAQKKTLPKPRKPIHMNVPKPPQIIKDVKSIEMTKDTTSGSPQPIDGSETIAVDLNSIQASKHDNEFNKYSNNKIFTENDVLLGNSIKDVDETSKIMRDALIIYGSNGTVVSFDPEKKNINWLYTEKGIKGSSGNKFTVDNATLYVPYTNGTITALDVNTGQVSWKDKISSSLDKTLLSRQTALVDKGLLFVAARNSNIYAINKINGGLIWNYRLDFEYNIYPPVAANEAVFINNAPYIYKFESQTGKAIWKRGFKKAMYAKMVVDGKRVYAANESNTLSAINPAESSSIDWEFNLSDNQYGVGENIILNNDVIYLAGKANPDSRASTVYAINKINGEQLWKTDLPKNEISDLSLIDDKIFGYMKDNFFVIDIKDGKLVLNIKPQEEPISNIIRESASTILYVSKNGLVRYSNTDKSFTLIPIAQLKAEDTDDKTTIQLVLKSN